jgi:hypothetical protein
MNFFSTFLLSICMVQTCLFSTCKVLIIGCGRSGTGYISTLLTTCGYDVGHEYYAKDGCASWPMVVNCYYENGPQATETFEHIFHQVRNPIDVITSWKINFCALFYHTPWMFVRNHLPQIELTDSLIVQCAKYWYYWNLLAEEKSEWRYKIEDFDEVYPEFCERLNIPQNSSALEIVSKNTNTRLDTSDKVTWEELENELDPELYHNIREMATRYGY